MVKHSSALRTTKLLASCRLLPDPIRLAGLPDCPKTRRILPFAKPELTGAHAAQSMRTRSLEVAASVPECSRKQKLRMPVKSGAVGNFAALKSVRKVRKRRDSTRGAPRMTVKPETVKAC